MTTVKEAGNREREMIMEGEKKAEQQTNPQGRAQSKGTASDKKISCLCMSLVWSRIVARGPSFSTPI